MAYLYQQIQSVPGLSGSTSYQKQADYWNKLGLGSGYKGTYQQNSKLLSYLSKPNYGLQPIKPASQPTAGATTGGTVPKTPSTPEQVPEYLQNYQATLKDLRKQLGQPLKSETELRNEVEAAIKPDTAMPELPDLTAMFEQKRQEYGVDTLEKQIRDLQALQDEAYARNLSRQHNAEEQQVRMGVIAGRQSEIARQEQEQIDFVGRQIQRKVDEVQGAYTLISTYMDLTQTDYTNAMNRYNQELNTKLKTYELTEERRRSQISDKMNLLSIEKQEVERQEKIARANIEIYSNMMLEGNLTWDKLDAHTKTQLEKMSVQAGLGRNFLKQIQVKDKIITSSTRVAGTQKYADIVRQRADGSMYVEHIKLGTQYTPSRARSSSASSKSSGGISAKDMAKYYSKVASAIREVDKNYQYNYETKKYEPTGGGSPDGLLSVEEASIARANAIAEVGNAELGRALFQKAMTDMGYRTWKPS